MRRNALLLLALGFIMFVFGGVAHAAFPTNGPITWPSAGDPIRKNALWQLESWIVGAKLPNTPSFQLTDHLAMITNGWTLAIKAQHINEFRTAVENLYTQWNLQPRPQWADSPLASGAKVRALHLYQLIDASYLRCDRDRFNQINGYIIAGGLGSNVIPANTNVVFGQQLNPPNSMAKSAKTSAQLGNTYCGSSVPPPPPPPPSAKQPTNLSLSHVSRSRYFTVSWTAGSGNGGANGCKLQFSKGTSWVDITSATNVNCDATTNTSPTLNGDGWKSSWGGTQVRIVRKSDGASMGTFTQALICNATGGSSSPTPNADEDCNGYWDNAIAGWADPRCPRTCTGSTSNFCVKKRIYRYQGTGCYTTASDSLSEFYCKSSVQSTCSFDPARGNDYKEERVQWATLYY